MTILDTETASIVAQAVAARESECAAMNAERLDNWKRRAFRDPVPVPARVNPPKWPALRVSVDGPGKVTKLRRNG